MFKGQGAILLSANSQTLCTAARGRKRQKGRLALRDSRNAAFVHMSHSHDMGRPGGVGGGWKLDRFLIFKTGRLSVSGPE